MDANDKILVCDTGGALPFFAADILA